MRQDPFGFLFAAGLIVSMSSLVSAGPIAGIARTDGQPLETGPFDSQPSAAGPEIAQITQEFQPMYLTSQPNTWTKTFRWEIPANTGLAPGATLSIMESIPLIYPADPAGTHPVVKPPIADWHESMVGGDASQFVQWDTQSPDTNISARIGSIGFPINGRVNFSADGRTVWFNFDPISIPTQGALASTPVTLDISKDVVWSGPVLDPIPIPQHLDILVSEFPTIPDVAGDYNGDGIVNAADYTVWCDSLGSTTNLTADSNGNGVVDAGDYDVWKANFGNHSGAGAIVTAAVPEPSTVVLMILAAAGWCLRRGRAA
jgi:hypothetical protein